VALATLPAGVLTGACEVPVVPAKPPGVVPLAFEQAANQTPQATTAAALTVIIESPGIDVRIERQRVRHDYSTRCLYRC
jgi:hypothetical protein